MPQQSVALFDLDYTLYKGEMQQYHVILDFPYILDKTGLFQKNVLDKMKKAYDDYKQKKIDRKVFADNTIQFYYEGVKGQSVKDIENVAKQWMLKSTNLWYPYTYELVELMRNMSIPTIIISGSPIEPLALIKQELGVDNLYATRGKIDWQGTFTGECEAEFANAEAKDLLIQSFNFNPDLSFAFGDSESDYPLLESVNPKNSFLFRDNLEDSISRNATAKGWQVHKREMYIIEAVRRRLGEIF